MKVIHPLQRTDLLDTRLSAHRKQIELLRKMPPEQKIRLTFNYMEDMKRMKEAINPHGLPRCRNRV